jgi:hypothetical protein
VHPFEAFDGFDFHDYAFDDEIQPIAAIDALVLVDNRQRLLTFDRQPARPEFNGEAFVVRIFEQFICRASSILLAGLPPQAGRRIAR